jgi:hypothetical protein
VSAREVWSIDRGSLANGGRILARRRPGTRSAERTGKGGTMVQRERRVPDAVRAAAHRVRWEDGDHDPLLELIGDARVVLLGEATHGTHEFYRERARITQRLIQEKGFTTVAVEADWPDAYRVNRYVHETSDDPSALEALGDFHRFPLWMWRNAEVADLVEWLRAHNRERAADLPVAAARDWGAPGERRAGRRSGQEGRCRRLRRSSRLGGGRTGWRGGPHAWRVGRGSGWGGGRTIGASILRGGAPSIRSGGYPAGSRTSRLRPERPPPQDERSRWGQACG